MRKKPLCSRLNNPIQGLSFRISYATAFYLYFYIFSVSNRKYESLAVA